MSFRLRRIAAYILYAIDWTFTWIATGLVWLADTAEDAAVRLRR